MRHDVAALYVDPRGPYPSLVRDWYDEKRDAKTYSGPVPVVAHPPCGPWGPFRGHVTRLEEEDCAQYAVNAVRRFGGVLEQPSHSRMFRAFGLPWPGEIADAFGGWTIQVNQVDWGHVARKRTWLYVVGVACDEVPDLPRVPGVATHWVSGTHGEGRGKVPPGIKVCSAKQRRVTPVAFAEWLLELASRAKK